MKKYILYFLFAVCVLPLTAQRGKDGAGNITAANTIVNAYTALTANANTGATSISVASTAGYAVGDLIMIIQMQGASVNCGRDTIFPDFSSSIPTNTTYGAITNYNNAGNYEFAQINSVISATSFSLDCVLQKNYTAAGKVQVIRVPRYSSLSVTSGFITCPTWNGTTGGVVVVESEGNVTLTSTPSFNVSGTGFRGGAVENSSTLAGATKFGHVSGVEGAYKGESIAGDTIRYKVYSGVFCRGAIANGGGGGTSHNAGGGGGSNGGNIAAYTGLGNPTAGFNNAWNLEFAGFATSTSAGGGRGGYTFSSANQNPLTIGPGPGAGWGGDGRRNMGGFGGRPLDYSLGKLFIGGGGGAGDSNDNYGTPAGNGGGMVYVLCYGSISGAGTILADGGNGGNTITGGSCGGRDGAGGGGGGGSVVLNIVGTTNLTAPTAIFARGGAGGNQNFGAPCFNTEAYGPGAGGGGGYVGYSNTLPLIAVTGGTNGIVAGNSGQIRSNFPPNGATMGGAGSTSIIPTANTITATPAVTICVNNAATLNASTNAVPATILWYPTIAGGSPIGTGSPFTTSVMTTPGTYTIYAGYCQGGTYRVPSVITVITGPTLTVNSPSICSAQSATLTANGATTYTWSTAAVSNSIVVNPAATTVYTVTGTIASCTASITSTVSVLPSPSVTVNSPSICSGSNATLTASGITNYTWSTGANTSSIVVNPVATTVYTITGNNGACNASQTSTVTISPSPTVTANSATICTGQSVTLTANGATTYTWNTGLNTSTIAVSPAATTIYTVSGSNGNCTNATTVSVNVVPNLTVSATSATICNGSTATITASGASTYTWSTSQVSVTINPNPTTTTSYTVTGGSGACTGSAVATVVVNPIPVVTASSNNSVICSGQQVQLSAVGATSYTWMPGSLVGQTVNVTPIASQDYTVTGADANGCSGIATTSITVNNTATLSVTNATVCAGQTATLTANGATTYTWLPSGVTGSSFTDNPAATTVYTVIGANGSCTAIATATIDVGSSVSISINQPTICSGASATLIATSPATTYTWSTGANSNSIVINPAITTTYSVAGNAGSCSASGFATVTVNSPPTLTVNGVTAICAGQTTTLTASGANTYTWLPGSISASSLVVSPLTNTDYTLTGTDAFGCSASTTVSITVSATGTINITASSASVCPGETTVLTANGIATTYTWLPMNVNSTTVAVTPLTNTDYTVVSNSGGCFSSGVITIYTISAPAINITTSGIPLVCSGSSVSLTGNGATSYTWMPGNINANSILVSPNVTTTYTVFAGSGSCTSTAVQQVTVTSALNITVLPGGATTVCAGQTATFSAIGATDYVWLPGGITGNTIIVKPGSATIYTVVGATGSCVNTKTFVVNVSKVNVDFAIMDNQNDNFNAIQFQNLSSGFTFHQWYFNNGTNSGAYDPAVYFGEPGTYVACLYARNNLGCSDTLCKTVTVGCAEGVVFIPNTFTPNGDGLNDVFKIVTLPQCIKKYSISIFNSWGQKIYTSDKFEEGWDGTVKGKPVEDNVYAYILEYTMDSGKAYRKSGHVTVYK